MLILNANEVRQALPMDQAIAAMKDAYASLSDGTAVTPLRTRLSIPSRDAVSLFMPAYLKKESTEALAVKVVSLYPSNPPRGLAYIQAAVLVFDPETGRAIALLEGSALTAIRTGAGSGAAIDILARKDSKIVAIFGAGPQGKTQLEAACTARKIETAFIYNPTTSKAEAFVKEMAGQGKIPKDIRVANSPKEAIEHADIICTATGSTEPIFDDKDVKVGAHISAIGAYTPQMQELPIETVARSRIVVDSRATVMDEAGDIVKAIHAGLINEWSIHAELGEIVLGQKSGRSSDEEITFFKSVGNAVQDAAAAQVALMNAHAMKLGVEVEF
ncbi:MAG: Delta(1)-pyrroline-2-carboxylate reductase [Anaerolineales bacterium]|nr:Delta(1)-pyrroline-2-carboxylate reductase [Anaerolineales bacterium]